MVVGWTGWPRSHFLKVCWNRSALPQVVGDSGVVRVGAVLDHSAGTVHDLPKQLRTRASQHVRLGNSRHCLLESEQPPVQAVADNLLELCLLKLRRLGR